jgi:hypothetical protein
MTPGLDRCICHDFEAKPQSMAYPSQKDISKSHTILDVRRALAQEEIRENTELLCKEVQLLAKMSRVGAPPKRLPAVRRADAQVGRSWYVFCICPRHC